MGPEVLMPNAGGYGQLMSQEGWRQVCGEKQVEQQQQLPVPLAQVALHQQRDS